MRIFHAFEPKISVYLKYNNDAPTTKCAFVCVRVRARLSYVQAQTKWLRADEWMNRTKWNGMEWNERERAAKLNTHCVKLFTHHRMKYIYQQKQSMTRKSAPQNECIRSYIIVDRYAHTGKKSYCVCFSGGLKVSWLAKRMHHRLFEKGPVRNNT